MKKDFQKFQNDFYAEVETRLPNFYKKVLTLQVTDDVQGVFEEKSEAFLNVLFGFTDVTGKSRLESVLINKTEDVKAAVAELNGILKEDYPAFAQYKDLEDVVKTVVEVNDPENIYEYTVQGTEHSTGHFKVYDLTFRIRETDGKLIVWYEDRDDPSDEYFPYFDYDLSSLWNPGSIAINIEFSLFQEA